MIVSMRENCVCKALGTVPWYTEYFSNKLQTITVTSTARLSLSMLDTLVMMNNKIVKGEGNGVSQKEGSVQACLRVEVLNPAGFYAILLSSLDVRDCGFSQPFEYYQDVFSTYQQFLVENNHQRNSLLNLWVHIFPPLC